MSPDSWSDTRLTETLTQEPQETTSNTPKWPKPAAASPQLLQYRHCLQTNSQHFRQPTLPSRASGTWWTSSKTTLLPQLDTTQANLRLKRTVFSEHLPLCLSSRPHSVSNLLNIYTRKFLSLAHLQIQPPSLAVESHMPVSGLAQSG